MTANTQNLRIWAILRSLYEGPGLLIWLSALSLGVAAIIHHESELPRAYTWFEPLRSLKLVLELPGFMVVVLGTYALGRFARCGEWDLARVARGLLNKAEIRTRLPEALRRTLAMASLPTIDALVVGADRSAMDWAALLVLGFIAGGQRLNVGLLLRLLGHAVVAALVFMAICYAFTVLKALTFVRRAELDATFIAIESSVFGTPPHRSIANWAMQHPAFVALCDWVYFRFFHHMALTTVLLIGLRQARQRTEYLGALAICYLLGGPLYHVWPGVGPGYFEPQYFEFLNDPGLMVKGTSAWLQANTMDVLRGEARELKTWGYIACMPSLHIAQECVMLYYARQSLPALLLSLAFTGITLAAVVVLGFHYPIDSLAGVAVASFAILIARSQRDALMPAPLMHVVDEPIPKPKPVFQHLIHALRRKSAQSTVAE